MKTTSTIARYLLGLIFLVFGLNGFLNFIHQPPPANPVAIQFLVAVSTSHYIAVVFVVQIIGGVLLLAGRFVPLGLAVLAPVLANILNYHLTMDPGGIGLGLITAILWVVALLPYRSSFARIFEQRPPQKTIAVL
jgi:putative oxidoreductase